MKYKLEDDALKKLEELLDDPTFLEEAQTKIEERLYEDKVRLNEYRKSDFKNDFVNCIKLLDNNTFIDSEDILYFPEKFSILKDFQSLYTTIETIGIKVEGPEKDNTFHHWRYYAEYENAIYCFRFLLGQGCAIQFFKVVTAWDMQGISYPNNIVAIEKYF